MSTPVDIATSASPPDLLSGLSEAQRDSVLSQMRRVELHKGEHLVRQGDSADHVYYVLRGRFEVLLDGRHLVAEIGAGEPVGEIAFFGGLSRTADVVASRDSEVLELSRENFDRLAAAQPDFIQSILRTLGRRLAATTAAASALAPRIADAVGLCAAGQSAVPESLVADLVQALRDSGSRVCVLRARDLPGDVAADDERLMSQWLGGQEQRGSTLLLVSGDGNPAWDRAALRHCDHLLLCGRLDEANARPVALGELERYAAPLFRPSQTSLLLWREQSGTAIAHTRHWLQGRALHLHHHVALDRPGDFGRVARLLTGRALGAVLGGGGALGAGHIGTLRALGEAGVELDIIGGTSIGSVVAHAYAAGDDAHAMLADYEHFFIKRKALGRFTLPWYSLLDHRHLDACMQDQLGDSRLEDLPLNFFAVGANLSTNELEVVRHGLSRHALRISTAIPVALPPWINAQGQVLVDGGVMNNVPISVMRAIKSGPNMVSMLSPGNEWQVKSAYERVPSRLALAWQLLRRQRRDDDFPRLGEVAARSMQITSGRMLRGTGLGSDLLLKPPAVPGMGLLNFKLGRAQEQAGYEYTRRFLDKAGGLEGIQAWQRGEVMPEFED
jgi:NTE family protein